MRNQDLTDSNIDTKTAILQYHKNDNGQILENFIEPLLTIQDLAQILRVKPKTLYNMVHRKEIPYIKPSRGLLRFSKKAIEAWLSERMGHVN